MTLPTGWLVTLGPAFCERSLYRLFLRLILLLMFERKGVGVSGT